MDKQITIEEFGATIKQKYPQYSQLPDAEIGQKMLAKYPQYQSHIVEQKSASPKPDILTKVARGLDVVFGGGKVGEAIGTGLAKSGLTGLSPQERSMVEAGPSAKEVAGDVAGIGLTVATLGGAGLAGKLGARVLKTGAIGAGFGASGAMKEGGDVTKSALVGGAVGAGLPIVGAGLAKAGKAITEFLPKSIMQSAIGQSKKELLAGKDVSEYALKNMKFGTADKLISNSQNSIEQLSNTINTKLTSETAPTVRILKNELLKGVADDVNKAGGAITSKEVSKIIGNLAPQAKGLLQKDSLSLIEANKLRALLDKTIGDKAFLTNQLPFNKDVLKSFANVARERVKELAPEGTRGLFSELSKEITLRNALQDKYAGKARNEVINAFDVMIAGGGMFGGGPLGAVGALGAKKAVQSAVGKTTVAVGLNKLKALEPIFKKITPAERAVILRIVGRPTQQESQNKQ